MIKRFLGLFLLVLLLFAKYADAMEEQDKFVSDMNLVFMYNTGFSETDLQREFESTVYQNPETNEWVIRYSYIGPFEISYSQITKDQYIKNPSFQGIYTYSKQVEVVKLLDRNEAEHPRQEEWTTFLDDLQTMKMRETHWHLIRQYKEQDGWNQRLGEIWQFWPYDEILSFTDQYGHHPSGFIDQDDPPRPSANDMSVKEAKVTAVAKLKELLPEFKEEGYLCRETYVISSSCWINHKEEYHPAWWFYFYQWDGQQYNCSYLVVVCSSCYQVTAIADHVKPYIDMYSIEHPNTWIDCMYIYINGVPWEY